MSATLSQRYITATTNLGAASENDVRAELEGSIGEIITAGITMGNGEFNRWSCDNR